MAAEGDETAPAETLSESQFVQQVTPFPMAQDLLLFAKQSLSESALLSVVSDAHKQNVEQGSMNEPVQTLESLLPEQPLAPFLQGPTENGVNSGRIVHHHAAVHVEDIGSVAPAEHTLQTAPDPDAAELGDVSEKRVGEKIALFEGLAVVNGEESEELAKRESIGGSDDRTIEMVPKLDIQLSDLIHSNNGLPSNSKSDNEIRIEETLVRQGSGVPVREDALFEGLVLVFPPDEAPDRETSTPGVDQVSVVGDSIPESSEEKDASQGLPTVITHANGTHKSETLGEILTRDRKEKNSRDVGRGAGEEITASRIAASHDIRSAPDLWRSTSKGSQGNSGDSVLPRPLRPATATNPEGNDVVNHRSSTSGTNIVGDILYNIAVGDEEGRSRQRILTFAAKRYAANVERNPEDHDALYNWALVLQESADNAGPEVGSPGKDALLEEACKKYEAATQLCPTLHEAYYNWAIAISDRAKIRGRTKEAEDLWKQACDRYDRAVQLNWNSPQALNNWGLALQELGAIVALKEKRAIVKKAIRKFRAAIRLRFDFHRAVYNLGTVLYGLGEDIARSGRKLSSKEPTPGDLNSLSAIYITAAHALKPDYPVYRGALRLVRNFLPLPYLRAGWLRTPPTGDSWLHIAIGCACGLSLTMRHFMRRISDIITKRIIRPSLLEKCLPHNMEKVDRKYLAHSYSRHSSTVNTESSTSSSSAPRSSVLRIEMEDILCLAPTADLSLPPGGGFCIDTDAGPQYLIADTWDGMDAWVDAIRLVYTIYAQGKRDALAVVLAS